MTVSKPEADYSNLHELAKMYEKSVLGRTLDTDSPVLFTMGILAKFNKDEDYMKEIYISAFTTALFLTGSPRETVQEMNCKMML